MINKVNSTSFGKAITGDYSKIQKVSQDAGYPVKYIKKIDERLHQMFSEKGDEVKFINRTKDVFDGCCSTYKKPDRRIIIKKSGVEIAELNCNPQKAKDFVGWWALESMIGTKNASKYSKEQSMLAKRRLLTDYFSAVCKFMKTIK